MKKISFLVILCISIVFVSCKKDAKCPYSDSNVTASQAEIDSIQRYMVANSLTLVQHPSGVFYSIGAAGTGTTTPSVCSDLTVLYQGETFAGAFFDGTTGSNAAGFTLGQTIEGWKKGVPVIKAGGKVTLYIPPSLGYGSAPVVRNGVTIIPANSYLKFTIDLLSVQ